MYKMTWPLGVTLCCVGIHMYYIYIYVIFTRDTTYNINKIYFFIYSKIKKMFIVLCVQ